MPGHYFPLVSLQTVRKNGYPNLAETQATLANSRRYLRALIITKAKAISHTATYFYLKASKIFYSKTLFKAGTVAH